MKLKFLSALVLVLVAFLAGGIWHALEIYPFGRGYFAFWFKEPPFGNNSILEQLCRKRAYNFRFLGDGAKHGLTVDRLFVGDSVVLRMWSANLYRTPYIRMASGGNIIECMPLFMGDVLAIKPKTVMLYIGGNDADGRGRQTVAEALETYASMIDTLQAKGVEVIIHGIHMAAKRRNRGWAAGLNRGLERMALERRLVYVPPLAALDFGNQEIEPGHPLTLDGEHLKFGGYLAWFKHIRKYVDDF